MGKRQTSGPRITLETLRALHALATSAHTELSGAEIMRATGLLSGTLYPILMRLEDSGWLQSRWEEADPSELGRPRRRLYRLTGIGQRAYETQQAMFGSGALA